MAGGFAVPASSGAGVAVSKLNPAPRTPYSNEGEKISPGPGIMGLKLGTREVSSAEFEAEVVRLVHSYLHDSESLRSILDKYRVASPEEIERKISRGELAEHPTYEDYLEALAHLDNMHFWLGDLRRTLGVLETEIPS